MTVPENPFFTKELRQFRTRAPAAGWWLLAALVLMVALVLETARWSRAAGMYRFGEEYLYDTGLFLLHSALCLAAARYGAERIYIAEYKASTLHEILTLPYTAVGGLVLKHVFPLTLVFIAWTIVLPVYPFFLAIDALTVPACLALLPAPFALGVGWLMLAQFFPPEYARTWRGKSGEKAVRKKPEKKPYKVDGLVRVAMASSGAILVASLWLGGSAWLDPRFFYGALIPRGLVWLPVAACYAWAYAQTVIATVRGTTEAEAHASRLRWGAVALAYYVQLGLSWTWMLSWRQVFWLLLFPAAALFFWLLEQPWKRPARQARQDPLTAPELAWLGTRWDNPVLLKDLRAQCRAASLRRLAASSVAVAVASCLAGAVADQFWMGGANKWTAVLGLSTFSFVGLFQTPGQLVADQWMKERKSSTLTLLLLTPLTSREILNGRLAAAFLSGWLARNIGALLLLLPALWFGVQNFPVLLAVLGAMIPCAVGGAARRGDLVAFRRPAWAFMEWLKVSGQVVLVIVIACVVPMLFITDTWSIWAVWLTEIALGALNCLMAVVIYNNALQRLEEARWGDVEMPGDVAVAQ